jgi:hypothetical protein
LAVRLQNAREEWTDRRTPFEWLFDKLSFTAELKTSQDIPISINDKSPIKVVQEDLFD